MNQCKQCVCCALSTFKSALRKLQSQVDALGGTGPPLKFHVQEQYMSTLYPPALIPGTWNTRMINNIVTNDIGAELNGHMITLPAGTYDVVARAPAGSAAETRLRLASSDGTAVMFGASCYAGTVTTDSVMYGRLLLTDSTDLAMSQYCAAGGSVESAGVPTKLEIPEIYSEIIFYKVA